MEKSGMNYALVWGFVFSPEQPWLSINIILIIVAAFTMTFFVIIGMTSLYYARNDLLVFVELAHGVAISLAVWILLIAHYLLKFPLLYDVLKMIDKGIFEYDTKLDQEQVEKVRSTAKLYTNWFKIGYRLALLVIFIILALIAPILIRLYGDEERKKIKQLNYNLPVPVWLPFRTDTFWGFTYAYLFFVIQLVLIFGYLSAAVPFLFFGIMEVGAQFQVLKLSIMNLESRALEKYESCCCKNPSEIQVETLEHDLNYERCVKESLKENIRHHAEILRFFNLYQNLTSIIFGVAIGLSMMILASLSLVLTKTKLFSFETVKFSSFFIVELVVVFGYCCMGTFITEVSREIQKALYYYAWFNAHERNRKMLKTFQFISGVSILLKGNGIFVIDLQLFVQILQTTYSIFNIFSSMEE